jgi:hypothetical protein
MVVPNRQLLLGDVVTERITSYKGKWWIPVLITFGFLLIVLMGLIVPRASAAVFVYGSEYNYSEVVLPNNSYVHQGENISQGNWYDLSGVCGWSGKWAHWKNEDDIGYVFPSDVVSPNNLRWVFIDPNVFPAGRYYQWDGSYCTDSASCSSGFMHGNAYVFYVVQQQVSRQEKIVVHTSNISISQNGSTVQIPVTYTEVQTYYGTPTPTSTAGVSGTIMVPTPIPTETTYYSDQPPNSDVQDQNGIPIVGGVAGAVPVTAKSPVPVVVPVIAIIVVLFLIGWKKAE